MKQITLVLACAMIAPVVFGQPVGYTSPVAYTSVVEHSGQVLYAPTQITTGAVMVGTVSAFNPGLIPVEPPSPIVVQSSPDTRPVSYMFGKQVRFVDTDGRAIDPHMIRAGTRVELGFDRTGRVSGVIAVGPGYSYGYYGGPLYSRYHGHRVYSHHHHYHHTS